MAKKNERIYDELLSFLGDPMFQIPVRTFLDENSLIFDPAIEPQEEHRIIHNRYKKLIDALLEGFCQDMNITIEEAIDGVNKMVAVPDLKEVFNALFDQVLAATDFDIFCQLMIKRNIMIQEQVLVMIIAATGGLPQSLTGSEGQAAMEMAKKEGAGKSIDFDKQEEEILKHVLENAAPVEEQRTSKTEATTAERQRQKAEAEMAKSLELSKQEAALLKEERKKMEENMKQLSLKNAPPVAEAVKPSASAKSTHPQTDAKPSAQQAESRPSPVKLAGNIQLPPSMTVGDKAISGSEAAQQWLASAQADAGKSSTHSAIAASLSKLSPEELKKRQEFLREQRDKLLAMKKQAREKQLGETANQRPQRPQSARAAKSAMSGKPEDVKSPEDEKKIAMRRAIAAKLRAEVIGDKY